MTAPFARANQMMGLIAAAMALSSDYLRRAAMEKIGPYESRGKGEGRSNRCAPGAGKAAHRAAMKQRRVKSHRARR